VHLVLVKTLNIASGYRQEFVDGVRKDKRRVVENFRIR
jgi:hypothetical protein